MTVTNELELMPLALDEARKAQELGEVPIGAVVAQWDPEHAGLTVLGRGHNRRECDQDPLAHAEIFAIREAAAALGTWRLDRSVLAVTLEPCPMCAGAIVLARVEKLLYGAADPKAGAAGTLYDIPRDPRLNHRLEVVGGVRGEECAALLSGFFRGLREKNNG